MHSLLTTLALALAAALVPAFGARAAQLEVSASIVDDAYALNPGDKLDYTVAEDPHKDKEAPNAVVSSLTNVTFRVSRAFTTPVLDVNASGMTLGQLREALRQALESNYYHKATVHLRITATSQRPSRIFFTGAVNGNMLMLDPDVKITLWEALVQIGTKEFANLKRVKVDRVDPVTKQSNVSEHDMLKVKKGNRAADIELRPGDRIDVPEKVFSLR